MSELDGESVSDLQRTAHHEAGHAVAAYLQRRRFEYATVVEDEENLGHVRFSNPGTNWSREFWVWVQNHSDGFKSMPVPPRVEIQPRRDVKAAAERETIILLAGYAAEWVLDGCGTDFDEAEKQWHTLDGKRAFQIARSVCMSDAEADAYVALMRERARNLLSRKSCLRAIGALATALCVEKVVRYVRARQIITEAMREGYREWESGFLSGLETKREVSD